MGASQLWDRNAMKKCFLFTGHPSIMHDALLLSSGLFWPTPLGLIALLRKSLFPLINQMKSRVKFKMRVYKINFLRRFFPTLFFQDFKLMFFKLLNIFYSQLFGQIRAHEKCMRGN
jgi:hypothetical protein